MIKKNAGWRILVLAIVLIFAGASSGMAEKITLKLNWVAGGDHCFYFVAKDKGLYEQQGLEVNIERGQGSGDSAR